MEMDRAQPFRSDLTIHHVYMQRCCLLLMPVQKTQLMRNEDEENQREKNRARGSLIKDLKRNQASESLIIMTRLDLLEKGTQVSTSNGFLPHLYRVPPGDSSINITEAQGYAKSGLSNFSRSSLHIACTTSIIFTVTCGSSCCNISSKKYQNVGTKSYVLRVESTLFDRHYVRYPIIARIHLSWKINIYASLSWRQLVSVQTSTCPMVKY